MQRKDFSFELPDELIAQYPLEQRSASRLLCLGRQSGDVEHRQFTELVGLLNPGDLLVFNNTRVVPARLYGQKSSGGKIEILIERVLSDKECLAQIRASKSPKPGAQLFCGDYELELVERQEDLFHLRLAGEITMDELMAAEGHMPLPPYIDRDDESLDEERYQTVYSEVPGAVAAPTAGLHFDNSLLESLANKGINSGFVTLHVGAGTFQPVRVDDISEHRMHSECFEVSEVLCEQVKQTRANGGRVIAVGTTSVRCLESASVDGESQAMRGDTDIFITPGYDFKTVDALITNFHLPESTLMMLVSAFAGRDNILAAYEAAVTERYRFFSYGDAMFIA